MTRRLKVLGTAFGVMLAIGAIAAGSASAAEFDSEEGHMIVDVTTEGDIVVLAAGTPIMVCSHSKYEGTTTEAPFSVVRLKETISGPCKAFGFASAHFEANECAFEFAANGEIDLACPNGGKDHEGEAIEITPTFFGFSVCTVKLYPGTYSGVTYNNIANGDITAEVAMEDITYEETEGSCGLEPATGSNATFEGDVIFEGTDTTEEAVSLQYTE